MALPRRDSHIEWSARPARQRDDVRGFSLEPFELETRRFVRRRIEKSARIEPHQAAVALLPLGQQHDTRAFKRRVDVTRPVVAVAEIDRERTPDDRLNAGTGKLLREFQRTE